MRVREHGHKADQDRAALIISYGVMCRVFRVRKADRVTPAQFASMANGQVMQACKDLYDRQPTKQTQRLERALTRQARAPLGVCARVALSKLRRAVKFWVDSVRARVWLKLFHAGLVGRAKRVKT